MTEFSKLNFLKVNFIKFNNVNFIKFILKGFKMAISIIDSFEYKGKKFLDERSHFATLEAMYDIDLEQYPNGFEAFCDESNKWYVLNGGEAK